MEQRTASKNAAIVLDEWEWDFVGSFDSYYNRCLLCLAGHVARMPMDRMPRKLLTG
jgi:hypothetical protein